MRVAICIGTFRRPDLLRELLIGLSRLAFQKTPTPEIEVIVVDNDSLGSAREICQTAQLPFAVKYAIEPRRGIAHVRNRAVQEAGASTFLAFIDDDEIPCPAWLDELLWVQHEYHSDVVAGPVQPEYVGEVPIWIKRGGFFDRPESPSGTLLEKCGAGNALVSHRVFTRVPGFDERFQLTGGEDTHFFLRVRKAGFSIVWSQAAVAHEAVTVDRANLRWILHRGFQSGNSWVMCELFLDGRRRVRVARFCKAAAYLLNGLATAPASLLFGKVAFAKSLRKAWWGAGMLAGLFGRRYLAYESAGTTPIKQPASLTERISI
jgi:GT2 family glycosyltransferase